MDKQSFLNHIKFMKPEAIVDIYHPIFQELTETISRMSKEISDLKLQRTGMCCLCGSGNNAIGRDGESMVCFACITCLAVAHDLAVRPDKPEWKICNDGKIDNYKDVAWVHLKRPRRVEGNMLRLDECYRDTMYSKRKQHHFSLNELAIILNCTHEQMVDAQIGKLIHEDVHRALVDWLEG